MKMADALDGVVVVTMVVATVVVLCVLTGRLVRSGDLATPSPTTTPGPVDPQPLIADHVAAVMGQQDCAERQDDRCLSWNRLRDEYGITIICDTMVTSLPVVPTNYGGTREYMPCGRVVRVKVADHIVVEGGRKGK